MVWTEAATQIYGNLYFYVVDLGGSGRIEVDGVSSLHQMQSSVIFAHIFTFPRPEKRVYSHPVVCRDSNLPGSFFALDQCSN